MKFPNKLKAPVLDTTDFLMGLIPRNRPDEGRLKNVRAVAHRGFCENGVKENTLDAFRAAIRHGTWGIEFDLRWTSDEVPIVHHDLSTQRVFGADTLISSLSLKECRERFSLIPTFEEVLKEFSGRAHLMIELKQPVADHPKRVAILAEHLKNFEPVRDYHLMGLRADDLLACKFAPPQAWLPIAEFNVSAMSRVVLENEMAGLTGQYVLLDRETIRRHQARGQKIGTGFIASRSVFNREVTRNVDWVFTNRIDQIPIWAGLR